VPECTITRRWVVRTRATHRSSLLGDHRRQFGRKGVTCTHERFWIRDSKSPLGPVLEFTCEGWERSASGCSVASLTVVGYPPGEGLEINRDQVGLGAG
jgi:hypothetical protein